MDNNVNINKNVIIALVGILITTIIIVILFSSSSSISGCYYITEHILSNTTNTPALCFDGKKVTLKINGGEKNYKVENSNDLLLVEDEYDNLVFRCTVSDNNKDSISCLSLYKDLGTSTNIWNKK